MKKLNIAFIWHFHQPNYQTNYESDFLLPWVRLHASKDYLDMLKKIDKFKNLKLNFNFSPILLNSLQKYANGAKDLHLELLLKEKSKLTEQDKTFILNNYFDLNYKNMVLKKPYFTKLYNKRASKQELNTDIFTPQQYCDIMALYTLCWIDESFIEEYPKLEELLLKEKNYTAADRREIYDIQLDIIKRIPVEYKKYQDDKKIEISISPYYHPVLPLLFDFKNKEIKNFENLPDKFHCEEDAKEQVNRAIIKYEELFGQKPKGMWLSEQCVCSKTTELLAKSGINWTVLDEGILSKTLKREFVRDFEGNLENPYYLNINYKTKSKTPINIIFADSFFSMLLNFGYGNYDYKIAANDMYEKIKTIQSKLENSPCQNHILTIAMDGENCWETYENDGSDFLNELYDLITSDSTLETVRVNDFVENNKAENIDNLKPGSWINRNFDLWIGEKTKNLAWLYLSKTRQDLEKHKKSLSKEKFDEAYREILIAQSSDWFWWFGEPNESRSDDVFDYLFRNHLTNVYNILNLDTPDYLKIPLTNTQTREIKLPKAKISPKLKCDEKNAKNEWENAGLIFVPDNPTSNVSRLIKNIYYGYDDEFFYCRFEINKKSAKLNYSEIEKQIAIYFSVEDFDNYSPIRLSCKNENTIYPIIKNYFSHELKFSFDTKKISKIVLNKATSWFLWSRIISKDAKIFYKDAIELKVPLKDLSIKNNKLSFFIIAAINETIDEIYPQDVLINLEL